METSHDALVGKYALTTSARPNRRSGIARLTTRSLTRSTLKQNDGDAARRDARYTIRLKVVPGVD